MTTRILLAVIGLFLVCGFPPVHATETAYPYGAVVAPDSDLDGIPDGIDNCPSVFNPDQADLDRDGQGDFCDWDKDGDGYYCPDCKVGPCPAMPCMDCDDLNPGINPGSVEMCRDGLDNDCDGLVDCDDAQECQRDRSCRKSGREGLGRSCTDGRDNDRDGFIDCDDPGCFTNRACQCVCPMIYDPVCGADGETYGNACEARCARVEVAYRGECGKMCGGIAGFTCPAEQTCNYIDPSCGIVDLAGVCVPVGQGCEKNYDPVCGCDGITYGNDCQRIVAGVTLAHAGECRKSCDDGSVLMCRMMVPICPEGTRVAVQNGCYVCVDPETCAF